MPQTKHSLHLDSEQLVALVEARHECVRQLHALGQRQIEQIAAGDFTQLLRVLGGRQRLLVQLQEIEQALAPFRRQAPETRAWSSPQRKAQCATLASQCERMLREIVDQEKQSELQLASRRDAAALALQSGHASAAARGAYAVASDYLPSQLDLSSER